MRNATLATDKTIAVITLITIDNEKPQPMASSTAHVSEKAAPQAKENISTVHAPVREPTPPPPSPPPSG